MVAVPRSAARAPHGAGTTPSRRRGLRGHRDAGERPRPHARLRGAARYAWRRQRGARRALRGWGDGGRAGGGLRRAGGAARARVAPRTLARRRAVGGSADPAPGRPAGGAVPRSRLRGRTPVGRQARGRARGAAGPHRIDPAPRRDGEVRLAAAGQGHQEAVASDHGADAPGLGRRGSRQPDRLRGGVAGTHQGRRGAVLGGRPHAPARGAGSGRGRGRGIRRPMSLVPGSAFVTGGGSGIGRAIAVSLAAGGAPVAVFDVQAEGAKEPVQAIERGGGRAFAIPGDASRWAGGGVTVNAICPGPIQTGLRDNSRRILGPTAPEMRGIGGDEAAIRRVTPAGRRGTVEEIAAAARYLASEEADYVTGHTLVIDGGWTAR